jgi:hypothetical protein
MLHELTTKGAVNLGPLLSPEQVADVHFRHFARCREIPGYVPNRPRSHTPFSCYSMADVLAAPHLLDAALNADILRMVGDYIGAEPVIYSVNAFWTRPLGGEPVMTQVFHRDFDEERFAALFFYLTDFTVENGAAQKYVEGSHDDETFSRLCETVGKAYPKHVYAQHKSRLAHAEYLRSFPVMDLCGQAGTAVLMLPRGLHCGGMPKSPRLLAWVRYGTGANSAYRNDEIRPVSVPGRVPDAVTRLILE